MNKKFSKVLFLMLALIMIVSMFSTTAVFAVSDYYSNLKATNNSVYLDGTNDGIVIVSLVGTADMDVYAIGGIWDTKDITGKLALNGIATEVSNMEFTGMHYADVTTGSVSWYDLTYGAPAKVANGTKFLIATYKVAADTPSGTYTVGFKCSTLTATDFNSYTDEVYYTTEITVTRPAAHVCSGAKQSGKSATCTVDGWSDYYKCTDSSCGKLYSDSACTNEITDLDAWKKGDGKIAASHDYGTLVDEDPGKHTAAEVKDGMKAHYFCDTCDTYFDSSKNVIEKEELTIKNEHSYTIQYGYKETDGHADTCSCGAKTTVVGHTPNISAPTETEDQVCSVCGYVIAVKTGHIHKNNLTSVGKLGANCTEDGYEAYYKCSCGAYFEDDSASVAIADIDAWKTGAGKIVAEGHRYTEQKKDAAHLKTEAAKCTEFDVYWYDCSVCDANAKDDPNATDKYYASTDAGDHSFNEKIADEAHLVAGTGADCQDIKKYYYDCDYCAVIGTTTWDSTEVGNHVKGALDHNGNQHWYKCAKGCDVRLEEAVHSGGIATCENKPVCSACNVEYDVALGHDFSTNLEAKGAAGHGYPCTNAGCDEYKDFADHDGTDPDCEYCGYVYHTCGVDTVTFVPAVPGTCVKKGYAAYYKCTDAKCGKLYHDAAATSIINSLTEIQSYGAHNCSTISAIPATCTTNGSTESMTCRICGMQFMTSTVIPATGHKWSEWTTTLEPTDFVAGSKSRTCSNCNEVETKVIPALGHEHTVVEIPAVAPTCNSTGLTAGSKCATCEEILVAQEVVPAIEHSSVQHVGANAATSTEAGNVEHWQCTDCETVWLDEERTTVVPKEEVIIPVIPETEPEETTQAPEETTAAPEETTAAPEETTAAPEETTEAPEETTQAPEDITVPEETTEAPVETTEVPEETTAAPEETTSPEVPSTGDNAIFFIVALIAFSAIFAFAVAISKKRNEN